MAQASPQPRYLAFDEGPFTFRDAHAEVAGVMTRGAEHIEAILIGRVTVDGFDATDEVISLTRRLPGAGPDVVLIDGITLGGLNLVDLDRASSTLDRPVLGITRRAPDRAAMERAVQKAPEPDRRGPLLPAHPPVTVEVNHHTLCVQVPSALVHSHGPHALAALLGPSFADGAIPEPLRLAHHVATAHVRGQSGTQA